ncbi:hypothetical protein Tsubulata_020572 [Turnera subulata]|uniref:DUF1771 domain-containing protein n=1 Tax=Turnera subulata TaxID=218843 RepID=A0A9Q0JJF0_9ROSI|nr:hypothetical protein Tsubulata_020572 [Turnera subulata]
MSLSKKGFQTSDTKLTVSSKTTALNPNAAEFIPFSLRSSSSPSGSASNAADYSLLLGVPEPPERDRPNRNVLPGEVSRFSGSTGSGFMFMEQQEPSPRQINGNSFSEKLRYAASSYGEDTTTGSFLNSQAKPWEKQVFNTDQLLGNGREVHPYNGSSGLGFMNEILGEHALMDDTEMNALEFLATQFPGFAADSLAEVYFANGCDLNLTIDILTQLEVSNSYYALLWQGSSGFPEYYELQVDGGFTQNANTKTLSAPILSAMDFPSLTVPDNQNGASKYTGDDLPQSGNTYRSSDKENLLMFKSSASFPSRGSVDFASAVRKSASQDNGIWKYDRNGSGNSTVGSSRSNHVLASAYSSGNGRGIYADRLQNRGSGRTPPVWLETGEAVANMYSEMREEARDHARLRNLYFEQARAAYLIGNKALAKEYGAKGQLHNMQMKAAHGKAQESIYRQRFVFFVALDSEKLDLHGLLVNRLFIPFLYCMLYDFVLNSQDSSCRSNRLVADVQNYTQPCPHHTRGSRTPARLPIAVQRYLLEEEGLEFTESQPGLLRVVIY